MEKTVSKTAMPIQVKSLNCFVKLLGRPSLYLDKTNFFGSHLVDTKKE